jgi:hypothetical protein
MLNDDECLRSWQTTETEARKLKVAERRLSRVQSMCMKHPEAELVSFWHGFQVTPKGPVVTMFVQQDQFHAFLRIDVM